MKNDKKISAYDLEVALNELHRNILKSDKIIQEVVTDYFYIYRNPQNCAEAELEMELNEKKEYSIKAEIVSDYISKLKQNYKELYDLVFP